jgi:hypothetical protein
VEQQRPPYGNSVTKIARKTNRVQTKKGFNCLYPHYFQSANTTHLSMEIRTKKMETETSHHNAGSFLQTAVSFRLSNLPV